MSESGGASGPQRSPDPGQRRSFLTARALCIGLVLAFVVAFTGTWLSMLVQGSNTGGGFFTNPLSHFVFFLIVGVFNVAVGAVNRSWALGRGELVTVFILMMLGNQSIKIAFYWAPLLSGPYYHASAENNWAQQIHPFLLDWILPNDGESIRAFYEGGSVHDEPGLWKVWIRPFVFWFPMLLAIHASMLCLMVILRRQWAERERLLYPLIQVAGSMIQDDERESLVKPFFRSPVMWLGFAVPFVIGSLQGLNAYFPDFPEVRTSTTLPLPGGVSIPLILSIVALSFFFLIKLEIAFSLWVFSLLNYLQRSVFNILGIGASPEPVLSAWNYGPPTVVHQSMGAMVVLVFGGLWVAREHLGDVLRKALFDARDVDDSDEIVSYRVAVIGAVASLAVMAVWLYLAGMPLLGVFALLFFSYVIFLALTRVVVEGGVAMLYTPLVPTDAALSALGTSCYGAYGIMALTYSRIWANDIFNFAMPHCANSLKLSEQVPGSRRPLFWTSLLAMMLGLVGATAMLLYLAYTYGAINMSRITFLWMTRYVYEYAATHIYQPVGPSWTGWLHTGIGGLAMAFLMAAQRFWVWWPLHPIGYPVSSVFSWMGYNAFLAWACKAVVLKYGGPRLYESIRPFFLGMIVGQFAIYGVFWVLDSFTGMVGNYLMQ